MIDVINERVAGQYICSRRLELMNFLPVRAFVEINETKTSQSIVRKNCRSAKGLAV